MKTKYVLTDEQRMYFSSVLLLDAMINDGKKFPIVLEDDAKMLEPILVYMASKGWLNVSAEGYIPTGYGREILVNHKEKLTEFRSIYKVYSAVDLGAGEFGFSSYFDFDTDEEFIRFINGERFEDLRVAVCQMKKINPLEVIFLEMVDEGRFPLSGTGWEAEISMNLVWSEMVDIANTNIHLVDLIEYNENNEVTASGEEVIQIILAEGLELSKVLLDKQAEADKMYVSEDEVIEEETTTTTTEYVDYVDEPYYDSYYYEPYYDPYFVSACWLLMCY